MIKKLSLLFILIGIAVFLLSCNANTMKMLENSISYLEKHKLYGETEDFRIVVTVGIMEDVPIIDGKKGETSDFVKITLIPLKLGGIEKNYSFKYGDFSDKFTTDMIKYQLGATLNYDKALDYIEITENNETQKIPLININDTEVDYLEALRISADALKQMINANTDKGQINREIYITIIEDTMSTNNFYYYVGYLGSNSLYSATLIDPYTRKAIAVRP